LGNYSTPVLPSYAKVLSITPLLLMDYYLPLVYQKTILLQ